MVLNIKQNSLQRYTFCVLSYLIQISRRLLVTLQQFDTFDSQLLKSQIQPPIFVTYTNK